METKRLLLFLQMAEAKRTTMLEQLSKERRNRNGERIARTQDRFKETGNDSRKISYSDSIKHLQVSPSNIP